MLVNAESLRKILDLECKKDYTDSAVFGGLDKFLHNWSAQAVEAITDPQLLRRFNELCFANFNYATLTKQQRKKWVNTVLTFLSGDGLDELKKDKPKIKSIQECIQIVKEELHKTVDEQYPASGKTLAKNMNLHSSIDIVLAKEIFTTVFSVEDFKDKTIERFEL